MTFTCKCVVAIVLLSLPVLFPARGSYGQEIKKGAPLPKEITWKLKVMDQEPIKIVTTLYDPKTKQAFWILELTRDLTVVEDGGYWGPAFKESHRPRFRFECLDEYGIAQKTVDAFYIGEYVTKKGKRFGAVLRLTPEVLDFVKTVEAVGN